LGRGPIESQYLLESLYWSGATQAGRRSATETELCATEFRDATDASMAFVRAQALLDESRASNSTNVHTFLLMSRAALWLTQDAHSKLIATTPTGIEEFTDPERKPKSMAQLVQKAQQMARTQPTSRALALVYLAHVLVYQVASDDSGPNARPGVAEAFSLAAEAEVFMAEIIAALNSEQATKIPPKGRLGPLSSYCCRSFSGR